MSTWWIGEVIEMERLARIRRQRREYEYLQLAAINLLITFTAVTFRVIFASY